MEKFNKFKINNSKRIFGGKVSKTIISYPDGGSAIAGQTHHILDKKTSNYNAYLFVF